MAVKPAPGETVEQTVRTRVIPTTVLEERPKEPFFEYCAKLKPNEWMGGGGEHQIYLYRGTKSKRGPACEKFVTGPFDQFVVQGRWGGGDFNAMMKRGDLIIFNEDFSCEGPARTPADISSSASVSTNQNGHSASDPLIMAMTALIDELRAARGGTNVQDSIRTAMQLNAEALRMGVDGARNAVATAVPPVAPNNPMDDLTRQFMAAAIQKMLNPADPIVAFSAMVTAMEKLGFGKGSGERSSLAVEALRQLPEVGKYALGAFTEFRRAKEIEATAVENMRKLREMGPMPANAPVNIPAQPVQNAQAAPIPPANATLAPPAQAELTPDQMQQMQMAEIERVIAEIASDEGCTVEEAARDAVIYLDRTNAALLNWLHSLGEEGLLQLFQREPILQRVPQNPRLTEFIKKFLVLSAPEEGESGASESAAASTKTP